ncbi:hypothetical protein [Staphylococcus saprophyticus]|uniref:hypothetical protein n=1 Tax=Staphylococcus saprophyticus TaxID=29385 RepID=UPI001247FC89|nr:hypothetical protein [Staphylococcus saprophyticus]
MIRVKRIREADEKGIGRMFYDMNGEGGGIFIEDENVKGNESVKGKGDKLKGNDIGGEMGG